MIKKAVLLLCLLTAGCYSGYCYCEEGNIVFVGSDVIDGGQSPKMVSTCREFCVATHEAEELMRAPIE